MGDGGLGFGEALGVFVFEVFHDGLLEAGVEPVEVLRLTAFLEDAALLGLGAEGLDEFPDGVDAVFVEGGTGGGAGFPAGGEGLEDLEEAFVFGAGEFGGGGVVAVGFVDDDEVGEFDDAFFDSLKGVSRAGDLQEEEAIGHGAHGGLALPDSDGFNEDDIVARGFANKEGFAGTGRDPAGAVAGG